MPRTKLQITPERTRGSKVQIVPRASAGKWIAWSADGRRIVALGGTQKA
jgi:hypothetical protein